ncbi:MAG: mechanosensitive ion channel family protein [Actinobacteria bacterium]|nr:mechanosensitive ion channel family protein [Actinomycetota bacterium]
MRQARYGFASLTLLHPPYWIAGMRMLAAQQTFADWSRNHGVKIVVMLAVALLITVLARVAVHRFERRLSGPVDATQTLGLRRVATLTHALTTAAVVVIWAIAFLLVLDQFDVNLAPLLASAGIAGVALGFGAQSLVRDGLSGFFILLENQLGVGDTVDLQTTGGTVSGKVEALTLRVTVVRAFDGTLHTVPNGNISVVSNRSRGWARAIVDVRVGYGEDVDRLREVLDELFDEVRLDPSLGDWIREGPTVLGVDSLGADAKVLRIVADTRTSKRMDVERRLREQIAKRLAERGIHVPVTAAPPARPPVQPGA